MWTKRTKLVLALIIRSVAHPVGKVRPASSTSVGLYLSRFNMTTHWQIITGALPEQQPWWGWWWWWAVSQWFFLNKEASCNWPRLDVCAHPLMPVNFYLRVQELSTDCMFSSDRDVLIIPVILCQWIIPQCFYPPQQFCRSHLHPLCVLYWLAKASTGCF